MNTAASWLGRIPLPAWANVLSLDAVFVAVAWQQLLMRVFCNRSTRWPEGLALSLTVWLIYVADRLLDGAKLDVHQPHTLRHRFYRRHRRIFVGLWMLGLLVNTFIAVCLLSTELLHNGLILASAVLVYGASVHFSSKRARGLSVAGENPQDQSQRSPAGLPKEVRVGVLFAMGVSLTTWTQFVSDHPFLVGKIAIYASAMWPLLATTCGLAFLFSWNCILVARFEREYDRAQAFPSIATRPGWTNLNASGHCGAAYMPQLLTALCPLFFLLVRLPLPIEIAGVASALGLMLSSILPTNRILRLSNVPAPRGIPAVFDVRSAWVDAVLWTPPLVLLCWL